MSDTQGSERSDHTIDQALASLGDVGLWTQALDGLPASEVCEVVLELEELGYPSIWLSEGLRREIFVNASMVLSATSRMVVGTGIANIWARDAPAMACAQLTLAEAFDGRFVLGMGVSRPAIVEGMRGQVYSSPLAKMESYLDAMDEVRYQSPRPRTTPPRVLAAIGPKMVQLAASRSAGVHSYFVLPEHTAATRSAIGPDLFLAPEQAVVLDADADRARTVARSYAQFYLGFGSYRKDLQKHGFVDADFEDGGSDRLIDAIVAWGDAEAVCARVQAHLDAGADHVAVQVLAPQGEVAPHEQWRELAPALLSCSSSRRVMS
jgi:probable F420-dependent oxidoreductase